MKKRLLSLGLALCMVLTALPAVGIPTAQAEGEPDYVVGYIPPHTPTTYNVNENTIRDHVYLPGDTIVFQPNQEHLVGFYLSFDGGYDDNTAQVATINSSYNATTHTSITATRPFMVSYKGQGSAASGDSNRCNSYCVTCYETKYTMDINCEYDTGVPYEANNPSKFAIYPADGAYTIDLTDYLNAPVSEGRHFNYWDVYGNSFAGGIQTNVIRLNFPRNTQYYDEFYSYNAGTITAKYASGCTVTLNANGGKIDGQTSKIYEAPCCEYCHNQTPFVLSDHTPQREGMKFAGWYADADLTQKITDVNQLGLNHRETNLSAKTLYAKWIELLADTTNKTQTVEQGVGTFDGPHFMCADGTPTGNVVYSFNNTTNASTADVVNYLKSLALGAQVQVKYTFVGTGKYVGALFGDGAGNLTDTGTINFTVTGEPPVVDPPENITLPFTDVSETDDWFYGDVMYVYAHKMMNGVETTEFSPQTTTSRAMIATILYRLEGEPSTENTNPFTDVAENTWYTNAVK